MDLTDRNFTPPDVGDVSVGRVLRAVRVGDVMLCDTACGLRISIPIERFSRVTVLTRKSEKRTRVPWEDRKTRSLRSLAVC